MTDEIQNDKTLKDRITILTVDRLLDSFDKFMVKAMSARFLAMTIDTVGYTAGVIICGILAIKKIIDPAVFISVLGAYGLLVQKTREYYFSMGKDKDEAEKNKKTTTITEEKTP